MGNDIVVNPGRVPVGVPSKVGKSVEYDPRPRTFAPVVTMMGASAFGIAGAIVGSLIGRSGVRAALGGALGAALGVGAGIGLGYLQRNSHHPLGNPPVSVSASSVKPLPAPTNGEPIGKEQAPSHAWDEDAIGEVRLGAFMLDTHATGFSFWPSWTQNALGLTGNGRVDSSGREDRYGSLADAMGAAERAEGQQAVVERDRDSYALVDLHTGDDDLRDSNSGADVKLRITSLLASDEPAVAIEYGDAWLTRASVEQGSGRPAADYWVRAPIS